MGAGPHPSEYRRCRGRPSKPPLSGAFQPTLASSAAGKIPSLSRIPHPRFNENLANGPRFLCKVRTAPLPRALYAGYLSPEVETTLSKGFCANCPEKCAITGSMQEQIAGHTPSNATCQANLDRSLRSCQRRIAESRCECNEFRLYGTSRGRTPDRPVHPRVKKLGEGGMAEVWKARNQVLGTPAAIKFLNQSFAGHPETEQ